MPRSKSLSEQDKKEEKAESEKKDLTGIHELASLSPPPVSTDEADPFVVNEIQAIEQVDDFASIDSLGMIDHEPETFSVPEILISPVDEAHDLFADAPVFESAPDPAPDPDSDSDSNLDFLDDFAVNATAAASEFSLPEIAETPVDFLAELQSYSERSHELAFEPGIKSPFHLSLQGGFDPYSRDKLLLFITENPIGINSSDLDLQLQAGKVLLPRISEFAGIKLIQELRDSGLAFKLTPSSRDEDENIHPEPALHYHYQAQAQAPKLSNLPVLPKSQFDASAWRVIDSVQIVQYMRAEILEVEKSAIFQELIDRMLETMKRKAELKGADALSELVHELTPLRLPSQYQVELRANLLKKI